MERPLTRAAEWTADFVQAVQITVMPQFLQCDIASSTASTYNQGVQRYQAYCTAGGLHPVLAPIQVRDFIACLVWANYKLSTIMVTLASLRRWAVDRGDTSGLDALDHPEVKRALKVASKLAVTEVRQKLPLALQDPQRVLHVLQSEQGGGAYVAARDAAMFVVGWAGMLRSSQSWCLCTGGMCTLRR
jgi:site-specific recombinase XerD